MRGNIRTGADRPSELERLVGQGERIGLLTNPTGVDRSFRSTVELCASLQKARLTALFACEHGIRGERQAGIRFADEHDERLGIPVFSLYGEHKAPTAEMLERIDTLVFDLQDLGVRFYTYLSTLDYVMQACAEQGKRLIVLDRPNPLGGASAEGGLLEPGFESMVGLRPVPFRTGLTIGEYARFVNAQLTPACELEVVELEGWDRSMAFSDTGLPWLLPSPNMPTLDTVRVYAGTCMLEGTNVSEGRGTTLPFEQLGAPWMDGRLLAEEMNRLGLPGVYAHPVYFTPTFSKHRGELCGGVRLFVREPRVYRSVETALHLLQVIRELYPERFAWLPPFQEGRRPFIDYLTGSEDVRLSIGSPAAVRELLDKWEREADDWKKRREPFLLYG